MAISVKIIPDWNIGGYESTIITLELGLIVVTALFAGIVAHQAILQKKLLKQNEKDFRYRNKIDSFKHIDHYLENNLLQYKDIINNFVDKWEGKSTLIELKNSTNFNLLLNELDTFAFKCKVLLINIPIINSQMGTTILAVLSNGVIKKMIVDARVHDDDVWSDIRDLYEDIKKYRKIE